MDAFIERIFRGVVWFFKRAIVPILVGIGAMTVAFFCLIIFAMIVGMEDAAIQPVPERVVLELNLEKRIVEHIPQDPFAQALEFKEGPTVLRDVVEALERASQDPRVIGLVAKVGSTPMGMGTIQELRDATLAFGESGKFTMAFAESFGEFGPGNGSYYLATAFDEIYLQPSGGIGLTGLTYESAFLRGTLDKLQVQPRLFQREQYKNMADSFTRRGFTDAHREALGAVMESHFDQMLDGISTRRGIEHSDLSATIDAGPLRATAAVSNGLVDSLLYRDQLFDLVRERSEGADLLYVHKYLDRAGRLHDDGPTIALIYGVGTIHRGRSEYDPLGQSGSMGSTTVAASLRAATRDEDVVAILFRVNSPGGSYVASDVVWREVDRAREQGIPVIVSMGDVAASGGYYVAAAAALIVAHPGTITGSIGVVTGKMLTRTFWQEHTGVTWDAVSTSTNAGIWSGLNDYSLEQEGLIENLMDDIYADFTGKVADGRDMDINSVLASAKGRIWTGADALDLGLIDALGGYTAALQLARTEAGLEQDAAINLTVFPREKGPIEAILEELMQEGSDNSEQAAFHVSTRARALDALRPLYHFASRLGVKAEDQSLRMPDIDLRW